MNAARWERINALFLELRSVPADQQALCLDQSCVEDAELRAQVGRLLAADDSAERRFMARGCPASPTSLL